MDGTKQKQPGVVLLFEDANADPAVGTLGSHPELLLDELLDELPAGRLYVLHWTGAGRFLYNSRHITSDGLSDTTASKILQCA